MNQRICWYEEGEEMVGEEEDGDLGVWVHQ